MANIIPFSFRGALFSGQHDFQNSGGNTFKLSLYVGSGSFPYTAASTVYSATDEVSSGGGSNYAVKVLTRLGVASTTAVASVDFDNVSWTSASFTANGALIYRQDGSAPTNDAVVVLAFGGDFTASNGTFEIRFPAAGGGSDIIRLG